MPYGLPAFFVLKIWVMLGHVLGHVYASPLAKMPKTCGFRKQRKQGLERVSIPLFSPRLAEIPSGSTPA